MSNQAMGFSSDSVLFGQLLPAFKMDIKKIGMGSEVAVTLGRDIENKPYFIIY